MNKECRINFRNRINQKESQQSKSYTLEENSETQKETSRRLSYRDTTTVSEIWCFFCNEQSQKDTLSYDKGGMGHCEQHHSKEKLIEAMKIKLDDESSKFHKTACRINVVINGNVYGDLFAVDVYYDRRCYSSFTYTYQPTLEDVNTKHSEDQLVDCFFRKIELKVLKDEEAYLLTDLLQDIKEMSDKFGLQKPPRRLIHTYQLKKMIQLRLGEDICISSFGNCDAIHSINVDSLLCIHATIKEHGLRKDDIVKVFANLV